MKRQTVQKNIRVDERLAAQCDLAAAKSQMPFSEWARKAFTNELTRMNGKRRAA